MKQLTQASCIRQEVDIEKLRRLRTRLLQRTELDHLADLLAMAGNATRLKILYLLTESRELCVCDLADVMGMTVSAVSHQLRKLRDRKVIVQRREGPTIYYRLAPGPLTEVLNLLFQSEAPRKKTTAIKEVME
ncbi:MAG: metalloregulator ArsR/SmtB family transcription factor [candidate division KSB1 bacterium]|nr:metalloregulator ArsR/SmtB family transcription factor [candidate division KSB1 bacterium]